MINFDLNKKMRNLGSINLLREYQIYGLYVVRDDKVSDLTSLYGYDSLLFYFIF